MLLQSIFFSVRSFAFVFLCVSLNSFALPFASSFVSLGSYNFPQDISSNGNVVVGFDNRGISNSFKYENGNLSSLNVNGRAIAVSGDGSTIVGVSNIPNGGFIYTDEAINYHGSNDAYFGFTSTNLDGTISVGSRRPAVSQSPLKPIKITNGVMESLPYLLGGNNWATITDISDDSSVLVGQSDSINGSEPYAIINGLVSSLGDLPGGRVYGQGFAVSADGNFIVGSSEIEFEGEIASEAFIYKNNEMFGLGDFDGGLFESRGYGVSNNGIAVGFGRIDDGIRASFWEKDSYQPLFIEEILSNSGIDVESQGWILTQATGISSNGDTVIGFGTRNGIPEGWMMTLTPVPLPAGIYLFLSGLVGLVGVKFRGRNA
tara:strand:- start:1041 stop:2162 length:1122 start_codon:yes stop_codon:yes gene_type:complete